MMINLPKLSRHWRFFLLGIAISFSALCQGQSFERLTVPEFAQQRLRSNSSSWADVDNDGDEDVLITSGENEDPNEFYLNEGNGVFRAVSNALTEKGKSAFSSAWGDYDNDGDLDVYIANCDYRNEAGQRNDLFRNDGNGQFTAISVGSIVENSKPSYACAWADYDNDGWLDLFVANAYNYRNRLYHNNGDGSFSEVTEGPVSEDTQHSISCSWVDYDNDGDVDLYVIDADWEGYNEFYSNNGDGTFTKVYNLLSEKRFTACRSASWGDYNNDGWMDVIIVDRESYDRLYLNMQNRDFAQVAAPAVRFQREFSGNGSQWGDLDNDGDLDLLLLHHFDVPREFHRNNGDGTFTVIENEWTTSQEAFAWSINVLDVDEDGQLDIFQSNRFNANQDGGRMSNFLFLNTTDNCQDAAVFSLRGTLSNRDGLGARVRLLGRDADGMTYLQKREKSCLSGGGYTTQSGMRLHFGLGNMVQVDSVIVDWPSGEQTVYRDLPWEQQHLCLVEDGTWEWKANFDKLEVVALRNPDCPGEVQRLEASDFTEPLQWFRLDRPGQVLGETAVLAIAPEIDTIAYYALDACGQSDTVWVQQAFQEVGLYPNPAIGETQVVLAGTALENEAQIRVYDASGRWMQDFRLDLEEGYGQQRLDLRQYASGTYLLQIESGCWQHLEKLVVLQP